MSKKILDEVKFIALLMGVIFGLSALLSVITAQEYITSDNFHSKTAKGITVVEFYASWNGANAVDYLEELKSCNVYRVDIVKHSGIQKENKVTSIPTIIIYSNGVEEIRFNPNIMMHLDATRKEVQSAIDEIVFNKFQ